MHFQKKTGLESEICNARNCFIPIPYTINQTEGNTQRLHLGSCMTGLPETKLLNVVKFSHNSLHAQAPTKHVKIQQK